MAGHIVGLVEGVGRSSVKLSDSGLMDIIMYRITVGIIFHVRIVVVLELLTVLIVVVGEE